MSPALTATLCCTLHGRHAFVHRFPCAMQVVELPGHCFACGAECHTRMFPTAIPHFKDVIIMSNACDACGYRDSEIKPGGGFSEKGQSITLQVGTGCVPGFSCERISSDDCVRLMLSACVQLTRCR